MGIRGVFLSAVVAVSAVGFTAQITRADTLADAMAGAYTHSGLMQQNRALLRAADEDVAQATASLRPIIGWSTELRRTFSNPSSAATGTSANFGLNLGWTLIDNGSKKLKRERLKQTVLATRQSLIAVEQNVLLAAVRSFMDVRRDSEIVALRQNNLRVITRELRAAEDRFDVGEVTRTDVALAQARLAGARAELAVAQGNLMASQAAYQAAVGRKASNLVPPTRLPKLANSAQAAEAIAVRGHPDMKAAQFQVAAAEIGVKEADVSVIPSVDLGVGVTRQNFLSGGTGDSTSGSVSITASGPIYSGGAIASASRQAIAGRDAARGGLHATRHTIRQSVGFAWAQLLAAQAQSAASAQQISASQVAFDGVREEAKLGSRTTLDVLNAEQELLDARANQITAQSAEFTAAYSLLAAMGLLTVDNLNLAVEKYDPEAYYNQVQTAPAALSKRGQDLDKILRRLGKE